MGTTAVVIAFGLGFGLARFADFGRPQPSDALLDADFLHGIYSFGGQSFSTEAAFLTAVGGSKAGITRTIGPVITGPELLANGSFDADVAGWAAGGGANAAPAWNAGRLQLTVPGPSPADNRVGQALSLTVGKAYRFGGRPLQSYSSGQGSVGIGAGLFNTTRSSQVAPLNSGEQYLGYVGADQATLYLGVSTNGAVPRTELWDDFTLREAIPLPGHDYLALSVTIRAITPAAASGNKVLFQADDAAVAAGTPTERNRLRIVWDASRHLRLVVTQAGTEQANLDLGVVEPSTVFEVQVSSATGDFKASLDGNAIVRDAAGTHPPIAAYRIGRSATGELWDGAIQRVTVRATATDDLDMVEPERAFAIFGDSTARGDGGGPTWADNLRAAYDPDRTAFNAGSSGQNSTVLRDGLLLDTAHRRWTTIIMDRPNSGETTSGWIANVKAALGNLRTARWLVVPPAPDTPEAAGAGAAAAAAVTGIGVALLSDPFFVGHTFDLAARTAYFAALAGDETRVDGVHFNTAGQVIQATHIKAFLDARGW